MLFLDVNECLLSNDTCDDECINTYGSFYCKCTGDSRSLSEDGVTCIGMNWMLIFSTYA